MTVQTPRLTAIGLLVLTIVTGAAQAAPRTNQVQPSRNEMTDFVSRLRHWFVALLTPTSGPTSIQSNEGSILDPNGHS
jgi:hypothetical protein